MKRITKIKWLKFSVIISFMVICLYAIAQDEPAGHTTWFGLRYWDEGDHPGADSVNQNLIDIDLHLHNRDKRIDSLKSAYSSMFNFPAGTWKKYDSTVFDNDTMKFKTGVVPLLSANNSFSGNNTFTSGELKYDASGPGGTVLNFIYDNDLGGVFIKKNNSTTLLEFNEADGLYWQFKYPITVNGNVDITGNYMVNGVPISSGGGDAYLTNRQTFTKRNIFSDTLKADGLSLIDNARITSNLNVTGDVISDLNFLKGSSTSIGTISTDSLALITNNTKRIVINKNGYTNFTDTVQMSDYVQINGNLNVASNIVSIGNITSDSIAGIGYFLTSLNATNMTSGTLPDSRLSSNIPRKDTRDSFTKKVTIDTLTVGKKIDVSNATLKGFNRRHDVVDEDYTILSTDQVVALSSIFTSKTFTLPAASSLESGAEIVVLDQSGSLSSTIRLYVAPNGSDAINGDNKDTLTTPYASRRYITDGSSKWTYDGGVPQKGKVNIFAKVITFLLAPIFSTLVDLPYGVTTTTSTVSGTATHSGYTFLGDSTNSMQFKSCMVKGKIGANTNSTYTFALPTHLLGNGFKRILSFQTIIRNDSTGVASAQKIIAPNSYFGSLVYYSTVDSGAVKIILPVTSNLINDSTFTLIWYRSGGTSNE